MTQMKIKGTGRLNVNIRSRGAVNKTVRRIVKVNGVISGDNLAAEMRLDKETLAYVVSEIVRIVRAGYEVRLGENDADYIRFFPLLDKECKQMNLIAQACGGLRSSISDLQFEVYRGGTALDEEEVKNAVEDARNSVGTRISVTPDTMVKCPECGFEFRVGKQLT